MFRNVLCISVRVKSWVTETQDLLLVDDDHFAAKLPQLKAWLPGWLAARPPLVIFARSPEAAERLQAVLQGWAVEAGVRLLGPGT